MSSYGEDQLPKKVNATLLYLHGIRQCGEEVYSLKPSTCVPGIQSISCHV